eukprot:CAMPEP_0115359428 /NCGR_PEP_ID=MMETSP0270-20121206/101167_1 /TAXON_ID=71861 /ORGANISM="Scrippsiella trochoidea, Strain CCMP3099" /LENGTH=121 /DNA_ID=CAMNT_0002781933 /DNA_START=30 /DNA_END=395 /DNA_ORIENTATION=+
MSFVQGAAAPPRATTAPEAAMRTSLSSSSLNRSTICSQKGTALWPPLADPRIGVVEASGDGLHMCPSAVKSSKALQCGFTDAYVCVFQVFLQDKQRNSFNFSQVAQNIPCEFTGILFLHPQ